MKNKTRGVLEVVDILGVIASGFATVHDLESLAEQVQMALSSLIEFEYGGIFIWDHDEERLRLLYAHGFSEEERVEAERTAWDRHPGAVFRTQSPLHVPDTAVDGRTQSSARSFHVRSRLFMPVVHEGVSLGVLGLASEQPNRFSEEHMAILGFTCRLTGALYSQLLARWEQQRVRVELGKLERLRKLNAELEIARDQALAATQAKSSFLASMSHELRTPLNAILGYAELADEELGLPDADTSADLRRIHGAASQLLQLINEVLDLAKVEAGQMTLHIEDVDLAELLSDVENVLRPLLDGNRNTLTITAPEHLETLRTDGAALRRVLINLLSNAIKFTEDGDVRLEVRAHGEGRERSLELRVEDTGIGMSEEELVRVFEAFVQANGSTSREYGGTGLGLTITQHLIDLMGGTIRATSTPGVGTTFIAMVPMFLDRGTPI